MKAIASGFMAGLGLLVASAVLVTEAKAAEPQASDAVPLAKRESVQLEFETERGLAYQVFSKTSDGDWKPIGQMVEGDGKLATVSYPVSYTHLRAHET